MVKTNEQKKNNIEIKCTDYEYGHRCDSGVKLSKNMKGDSDLDYLLTAL